MRRWMIGALFLVLVGCGADLNEQVPGRWKKADGGTQTFTKDGMTYLDTFEAFGCWKIEGDQIRLYLTDQDKATAPIAIEGVLYTPEFNGDKMLLKSDEETLEFTRVSAETTLPTEAKLKQVDAALSDDPNSAGGITCSK